MPDLRALTAACILAAVPAFAQGDGGARDEALRRLVRQDCGACHGLTLAGGLGPDIRAETLDGAAPEGLAAIILDGVPGTAMPPWRPLLSEEDALWIANELLEGTEP